MTIAIVSVTNRVPTESYYAWTEFHKSIERHGMRPIILGMGAKWSGLMTKPRTLHRWLKDGRCESDCLIVVDSWDLVFTCSPDVIAAQWEGLGKPWMIGGERTLFPSGEEKAYPECASSYRFPNSGFIISTPADMLTVLESMNLDAIPDDYQFPDGSMHHANDQEEYQMAYLKQPVPMRIDTECQFVWNLCGVDLSNFDFTDCGIVNRETGTKPCCLHFNGPAKTEPAGMQEQILHYLGLR
jgi:hypothetical protein